MRTRWFGTGVPILALSLAGCVTETRAPLDQPGMARVNTWQRYALIHQPAAQAPPQAAGPVEPARPAPAQRRAVAARERLAGPLRCDPRRNPAAARDPACTRQPVVQAGRAESEPRQATRSVSIPAIDTGTQPTLPTPSVQPTLQPPAIPNPPGSATGVSVPYNPPSVTPIQVVSVPTFVDNLQTPFLNPSPTKGYVIVRPPPISPRSGLGPVIRR